MGFLDRFRGKKTWDPGEDSTIRFSARARFISPACETRPRWTYLTAGLSLAPGRRPLFPCELVAYWPERNPRCADMLFGVAEAIAGAPSSEPFDPGHVVNMVGDDGEITISFALAQPDEPE